MCCHPIYFRRHCTPVGLGGSIIPCTKGRRSFPTGVSRTAGRARQKFYIYIYNFFFLFFFIFYFYLQSIFLFSHRQKISSPLTRASTCSRTLSTRSTLVTSSTHSCSSDADTSKSAPPGRSSYLWMATKNGNKIQQGKQTN